MKSYRKSKWEWYSVKLIFESIISGEPEPEIIDRNYTNIYRNFEESIIIVRAQSFDHAYKIAEKKASSMEMEYTNPYGETVSMKFVEAVHCYLIGNESLDSGTEVYWRQLRVTKDMGTEAFLDRYYPETVDDNSDIFYNAILLNGKFSRSLNSKD
ncbi:DUF4288 domain-containing protein [Clostridium omnivorum]|uniref:S-ribosylhomocysteinase n=1 Tax=Clostridium omnivorum TaxID=1604902 RepID=A0ABQ5N5U8_9CLOT|nr:DUF4288 domain-containing protein [Clostridium sp. E14]GLC30612.1 S-ribosylhomocysteinase [Clostridium sp. E14]